MDEFSPPLLILPIKKGQKITGAQLSKLTGGMNRMNAGCYPPQQILPPAVSPQVVPPTNIEIELDGGGSAIASSLPVAGRFERVPAACTIVGWRVKSDVSGSIAVDILRNGTSIVGSGTKPALSSSADSNDQVPTGWATGGTQLARDDILTYSISGTAALTYAKVILWVQF